MKINVGNCRAHPFYGSRHPILRFIGELKQDNLLDLYFEALSYLIHDVEMVADVEKFFFRKDTFKIDFQSLV